MKKYDIFISYSHDDKAFAEKVCAVLDRFKAKYKFEYFIDTEGITIRDEYLKRIARIIRPQQLFRTKLRSIRVFACNENYRLTL